ncbi:hypothetical protein CRE_17037 [Caenorhabditis remanei]|uniref:Uncharacterized protein n=1 Tax=Caenorhabditis remanei TaxID=31234 RepID=E3M9U6_CAERE|nr:hypothetical protein CRE_17037 [Caenorhabditis remanei]
MMSKSNESKKRGVVGQVKVKKEEPEMDDDNLAPPPPAKRGPGRPRRAERAGERGANPYINDDNMAPLGKRGRRRPRRVAQAGENGVSSQYTPQAKRGRGRPRRVVEAGNGGSRDAPPAKRGRGRPKREVKAEEGELNENVHREAMMKDVGNFIDTLFGEFDSATVSVEEQAEDEGETEQENDEDEEETEEDEEDEDEEETKEENEYEEETEEGDEDEEETEDEGETEEEEEDEEEDEDKERINKKEEKMGARHGRWRRHSTHSSPASRQHRRAPSSNDSRSSRGSSAQSIRHGPPADCVAGRTRSQFQKWNIKIEKEEEANTEENETENQKVAEATMAPVPFHGNVDEEDSDDEDPRNNVEGEGPGMHELVSDTEEEDNKESVSDAPSVQVDPQAPALSPTSEPPAAIERKPESPLKVEENVIDGVADASVNPTPASSAFDEDEKIESPANNRSLPEEDDHFVEGPERSDDIGSSGYADDVEHLTSPARLVPLESDPVCGVTGQVVTVTRSPPCFFADTVMLCPLCNRIYEERQKRHEELYQIVSKFF